MLSRFPLNPVLPARDGDRARAFYRDVLGLTLVSGPHDDPMMFTAAEGTRVLVTEIPDRARPTTPSSRSSSTVSTGSSRSSCAGASRSATPAPSAGPSPVRPAARRV